MVIEYSLGFAASFNVDVHVGNSVINALLFCLYCWEFILLGQSQLALAVF